MTIFESARAMDRCGSPTSNDLDLLEVDVDAFDRDGVVDVLAAARRLRSRLDAVELRAHRRLRALASVGAAEPSEVAVAEAADGDGHHGHHVAARDELCLDAPSLEDALDVGQVSGAHLDAVASAAKHLPDDVRREFLTHADDLVRRAGSIRLDAFRRECRQLANHLLSQARRGSDADELNAQRAASKVSRWVDKATGMHHTLLALDPVRDSEVLAATTRQLARARQVDGNRHLPWKQLEVDAWVDCLLGRSASTVPSPRDGRSSSTASTMTASHGPHEQSTDSTSEGSSRRVVVDRAPQIIAVTDVRHLRAEATRTGVCETSDAVALPISTLRRLCCDAEIIPVVMDGPSRVLDLGRSKRTASAEQRHALRAMHASCVFPGCGVPFEACRIHHVDWWTRDVGRTDLARLVPICEHDHHRVHEGGWSLTIDGDRVATWSRPDGVVHRIGRIDDRIP